MIYKTINWPDWVEKVESAKVFWVRGEKSGQNVYSCLISSAPESAGEQIFWCRVEDNRTQITNDTSSCVRREEMVLTVGSLSMLMLLVNFKLKEILGRAF